MEFCGSKSNVDPISMLRSLNRPNATPVEPNEGPGQAKIGPNRQNATLVGLNEGPDQAKIIQNPLNATPVEPKEGLDQAKTGQNHPMLPLSS